MKTKTYTLLVVLILNVFLLQAPVSAGGIDRHIFAVHLEGLAKQLGVATPPTVQHNENQVCFNSILDKIDQLSLTVWNTLFQIFPSEKKICLNN